MNKMYSPTPYFFGRVLSHMLLQIFAPLLFSLIIYFGLGIDDVFKKFIQFVIVSIEINLVGVSLGYFCGVAFINEEAARQISQLIMICFHLLSGGLTNSSNYNAFTNILQYLSANRYSVELYFRIMLYNNPHFIGSDPQYPDANISEDQILASEGFEIGALTCHIVLFCFSIFFFLLGWITIVKKNKKFA